jgi:monothiol glutaredoxin
MSDLSVSRPPHSPVAAEKARNFHAGIVDRVRAAVAANDVVVIGMGWNPHVKRAREALTEANIPFEYLEFGNYASLWSERLAVKLWAGWPTFPQVFVKGVLVGGNTELRAGLADGSVRAMLDGGQHA